MASRFNLFNNSPASEVNCILSYWDKDLVCRFVNNQVLRWFGKKPLEIIDNIKLKEFIGTYYKLHLPHLTKVFSGKSQMFEYEMVFHSGEKLNITATYYPDLENGIISGFFLHLGVNASKILSTNSDFEEFSFNEEAQTIHHIISINDKNHQIVQFLKTQLFSGFPSLEYLANLHLVSVSKLMRDFKKTFHTSPFMYYRNLQMEFASNYIKETKCSKKQMALMLGFSNPANFTTCYKRFINHRTDSIANNTSIENFNEKNRLLIAQLPVAVAMLDMNMNYLVASKEWLLDFHLFDKNLLKINLFDYFPDKNIKWKNIINECLNGSVKKCDVDYFETAKGEKYWLKWDIRPWSDVNGRVGGLIIYTSKIKSSVNEL